MLTKDYVDKKQPARTYRAEHTYAISGGKWYYEVELVSTGYMKVGFAKTTLEPGVELGMDAESYAFDGHKVTYSTANFPPSFVFTSGS